MSIDKGVKDFVRGFGLPLEALRLIFKTRGLKRYFMFPVVLNAVFYSIILFVIIFFCWDMIAQLELQVPQWDFWGGFGAWLSGAVNWTLTIFKWFIFIAICFLFFCVSYYSFIIVGMVVTCPLNDILSEKTEAVVCGKQNISSLPLKLTVRATVLSIWDALIIVLKQGFWSIVVLPLIFIPAVGTLPLFFVTAHFTALGFMDAAMARNYLRNRHKKPVLKDRRWSLLGLGTATELLFLIPFVGLFVLPVGVVAGTKLYCECSWEEAFKANGLEPPRGFNPPFRRTEL